MKAARILYTQYTNPAGYPPLDHSSRILAEAGWEVLFLGTGALGADKLEFRPHPRIRVRRMRFIAAGWRQKVGYAGFVLWAVGWSLLWRPKWVYASDPLSCPAGMAVSFMPGVRVIYHEHDSPSGAKRGWFRRVVGSARRALARRAELCIVPNSQRAEAFAREVKVRSKVLCVWNCPTRDEALPGRREQGGKQLWILYHGSIVPSRLPRSMLEAVRMLPKEVRLRVVGYETVGHRGYVKQLRDVALGYGIAHRVEFIGTLRRDELLETCRACDVGIAFMPKNSDDINERHMVGASNKPFDYMACGLALLVSDLPEWRSTYVEPGYALACDSDDPASIAGALGWFLSHPGEMRAMGERGRLKVLSDWNYEAQFAPVLGQMVGEGG